MDVEEFSASIFVLTEREIMNVFVTVLQHEYGIDLRVCTNQEKALEAARSFMNDTIDEIEGHEDIEDQIAEFNENIASKGLNNIEKAMEIYNEMYSLVCEGEEIHHISIQEKPVV